MFILILIFILVLPGALLPIVLKSRFSPEELIEMGVYMEEFQFQPSPSEGQINCSQGGILRPCAST